MLPRADLNLNRPPASLESATPTASSTDARLEVFRRLTQIAIGRELQVTVDSLLDDGTFLVKVADTAARMSLPVGTKVGDTLSMVFVAREPRPTFLLTQQGGSAPASLSTAARLIDHLLQTAEQDGAPPVVAGKTPLATSPAAANPQRVAVALQDSLASSGLFYESHLHDWISGSRPLADLAREPQARLSQPPQPAPGAPQNAANPDLGMLAAGMREVGDGANKLMDLIREARLHTGNPLTTDADIIARPQTALPSLDPESARLINLQLNVLEHQQIRWQGELWPGQKMEWEVSEDQHEGGGQQQEQQSIWSSVVRFELPHLGNVSATIRLSGERVHVQVNAASAAAAAALRENSGMLADALEAAGSPLDSLLVKRDEPA